MHRRTRGVYTSRCTDHIIEPGPDRISPPKRVYGFSRTGLRKIHVSDAKRRPLEALLAALERMRAGLCKWQAGPGDFEPVVARSRAQR